MSPTSADHCLVTGLTGCMLSVTLETVMIAEYAGTTNKAGLSMGVFFSFCFISFYGGGIDVVGYVYCCKSARSPDYDPQAPINSDVESVSLIFLDRRPACQTMALCFVT